MPNLLVCFAVGGLISVVAQILIDLTRLTPARILVLYVCLGTLLYATGVYDYLFSIAGAGIATPLVGFGAGIAKGVKEAIDADGAIGILTGGLSATSAGITFVLVFSLFLSLFCKGKPKRM